MPNYYQPEQPQPGATDEFQPRPDITMVRRRPNLTWRDIGYVVGLVTFLYMGFSAPIRHQQLVALERDGIPVTATITGMHETFSKSPRFRLNVQFQADGQVVNDVVDVSYAEYKVASEGVGVLVTYLPSDPSVCRSGHVTKATVQDDGYAENAATSFAAFLVLGIFFYIDLKLRP